MSQQMTREVYFPKDYDASEVDPRVLIRSRAVGDKAVAKYGEDVREAMREGIEISSATANQSVIKSNEANALSKQTDARLDTSIGGLTQDSEVADSRKGVDGVPYPVLSKRLNTEMSQLLSSDNVNGLGALDSYYFESKTQVGGVMPTYIQSAADDYVATLKNNADDVLIGFITDDHYQIGSYTPRSLNHYSWFSEIARQLEPDFIISGGDNINGDIGYDYNQNALRRVTATLNGQVSPTAPIFWLMGNHDNGNGQAGRTPNTVILQSEMKRYFNTKGCPFGEVRDGDSLYFYKDFADKKLRLIGLDGFDLPEIVNGDGKLRYTTLEQGGYQQRQITFLANALKLPSADWKVIIFCHTPLSGADTSESLLASTRDKRQFNDNLVRGVLNAFEQGTSYSGDNTNSADLPAKIDVDFTEQGKGTLIGEVAGHMHKDVNLRWNGINFIARDKATAFDYGIDIPRLDSIQETAFDFIGINYGKRTMTFYRFGYGNPMLSVTY